MKESSGSTSIRTLSTTKPLPGLLTALVLATSFTCAQEARAEEYITGSRGRLPVVRWPQARKEIQLVDESARFIDCRAPREVNDEQIVIPPMQASGGSAGGRGVTYVTRGLTNAQFSSNIPAGGLAPRTNLPQVKIGGLSPIDQGQVSQSLKPVRPIGLGAGNKTSTTAVAAKPRTNKTAVYGPEISSNAPTDPFLSSSSSKTIVRAVLIGDQK